MTLTASELEARARAFLLPHPLSAAEDEAQFGCHVIAQMPADAAHIARAKPAAVLIPIIPRQGGLSLLFTERAAHLKNHAGQIAFPGGRIEAGESAGEAAIREAEEEVGLKPHHITPLGFLPPYFSGTGYRIQPLVALVSAGATLIPDPNEVARIFEIPLAHALDLDRYRNDTIFKYGRERIFTILDVKAAYIWGVTAGILRSFAERF